MNLNKIQTILADAVHDDLGGKEGNEHFVNNLLKLEEQVPSLLDVIGDILDEDIVDEDIVDPVDAILESLKGSKSGLFATYSSLKAINVYATELLKSSALRERESATILVLNIYHNTLIQLIIDKIEANNAGSNNNNEQSST